MEEKKLFTEEECNEVIRLLAKDDCYYLTGSSDFFDRIAGYTYKNYFMYQVAALEAIFEKIEDSEDNEVKRNLQRFVDSLERVNEVIYSIVENEKVLQSAAVFFGKLEESNDFYNRKRYRKTAKTEAV